MADQKIYIDSGADPGGDGSIGTPYDSPDDISAGDWTALNAAAGAEDIAELNFQGTITDLLTMGADGDSVSGTRIVIQGYGIGVLFDGEDSLDTSIDTNGHAYLTIKDLNFTRSLERGIWLRSNGGRKPEYVTVEDCDFYNLNKPIHTYGNTEALAADNIVIRRCKGWDNLNPFMSSKWINGVDYYSCSVKDTAVHGFSAQAHMLDEGEITGGWELESGTIYWRSTNSNTIYKVVDHTNFIEFTESASAYDSIGVGEYKVNGGNIYINSGENPNSTAFRIAVTVCGGINYYDSTVDTITNPYGGEGHGFVFDDFATGSFNRCASKNCISDGFVFHMSEASTMNLCVSYNNGRFGAKLNVAANNIGIYQLVTFGNGSDGIHILGDAVDYEFKNNIITDSGGYGLNITFTGTQTGVHDYNYFYNSVSGAYSNTTQSANEVIDTDPLLTTEGKLKVESPALGSGVIIPGVNDSGEDIWGNSSDRDNIGAYWGDGEHFVTYMKLLQILSTNK